MTMHGTRAFRWGRWLAIALAVVICAGVSRALARSGHEEPAMHEHAMTREPPMTAEQRAGANALVEAVRTATGSFPTPSTLPRDFQLLFGCVSGGDFGAMGLHYVNLAAVGDGMIDPMKPEIVLYEPTADGQQKITGADFIVYAVDWDAKHPDGPPQLGGQLFHFFDSPNRFGLPAFYTLHVWAWKDNPNGMFTNWNPTVSCEGFNGVPMLPGRGQ